MEFFPDKNEFKGQVWIKTSADLITPVAAALKLQDHSPYAFLLESVEGGAKRGRYSIIGIGAKELFIDASLEKLRAVIDTRTSNPALPPMATGYYGFMGYDMVRHFEKLPNKNPDELGIPDSVLLTHLILW